MSVCDAWEREKNTILRGEKKGHYKNQLIISRGVFVFLFGLLNVALGILLTIVYSRLNQVIISYPISGTFVRSLPIEKSGEYKMYIQLSNFYQTYLRYTKSINVDQLRGEATENVGSCDPLERGRSSRVIYPCGLIANSFFQDGFHIANKTVDTSDISWKSERNLIKPTKYKLGQIVSPPLWTPYKEVPNLSRNYRLINWLSLAPFPTFRKLYGKVFLEKGMYKLTIRASYPFGSKAVVFTETSWAGVRNLFLSITMVFLGLTMCIFAFLIK